MMHRRRHRHRFEAVGAVRRPKGEPGASWGRRRETYTAPGLWEMIHRNSLEESRGVIEVEGMEDRREPGWKLNWGGSGDRRRSFSVNSFTRVCCAKTFHSALKVAAKPRSSSKRRSSLAVPHQQIYGRIGDVQLPHTDMINYQELLVAHGRFFERVLFCN